jgi:hypothetical protein
LGNISHIIPLVKRHVDFGNERAAVRTGFARLPNSLMQLEHPVKSSEMSIGFIGFGEDGGILSRALHEQGLAWVGVAAAHQGLPGSRSRMMKAL